MTPPRYIRGELFLRGPIPLTWIVTSGKLSGKALHVGMYLWHLAGLNDCMTVKLSTTKLESIGVAQRSAYRALDTLEAANLISIDRHPGRNPVVTILIPGAPGPSTARLTDFD